MSSKKLHITMIVHAENGVASYGFLISKNGLKYKVAMCYHNGQTFYGCKINDVLPEKFYNV